jgi:hypothetical protein
MEKSEIAVNPSGKEEHLTTLIEEAVAHFGLHFRMRSTLHSYRGSLYWHVQKPGERATLDVTLWPAGEKVWFSIQAGRRAAWIVQIVPHTKAWIEKQPLVQDAGL